MNDTPQSIGQFAQLACTWEVLARKAGNVCPGREFPDLTVKDFLLSAAAIAPVLDQAPQQPLGVTILRCIEETRKVVNTNTNLGIVLLLAPLASVPLDQPLMPGLSHVLARTTVEDSRKAYEAIRLANPGGLSRVNAQDVGSEPTLPLREVMELARRRDLVAAQYARDLEFFIVLRAGQLGIPSNLTECGSLERVIVEGQIYLLARSYDSLIMRKIGKERARDVLLAARNIQEAGIVLGETVAKPGLDTLHGRRLFREFDAFLRSDNHARNPGTTADLIAAALFVALREKLISPAAPFTWDEHPFEIGA